MEALPSLECPALPPAPGPSPGPPAGEVLPWDPAALAGRLVEITPAPAPGHAGSLARGGPRGPSGALAKGQPEVPEGPRALWDAPPPWPAGAGSSAVLTAAAHLVWKAQHGGEPVAWIAARPGLFFPPDFEHSGIDLAALVVVRVPGAAAAARAADKLLRSGAFGLLVADLGADAVLAPALATRLLGLAHRHHAAVVFLCDKPVEAPSLSPVVSLRAAATCLRGNAPGRFVCRVETLKDKREAPGRSWQEAFRGPPGLR